MIAKSRQIKLRFHPSINIKLNNENLRYTLLFISGPLGAHKLLIENSVNVQIVPLTSELQFIAFNRRGRELCGTYLSIVLKVIQGLECPFERFVELRGLGLRSKVEDNVVELTVGLSHVVKFKPPAGVLAGQLGSKNRIIKLTAIDWPLLSQTLAVMKLLRPAGVYKEKGIYEKFETVRYKEGKKKKFG